MMMTQSFFGNSTLYGLDTSGVLCKITDMMEHFFIVHPESGRREGTEHERVMFFSPTTEPIDRQARFVELSALWLFKHH
ncbi:hypothetical protein L596_022335 [Steinernema carpocapsae]|uniref:Uncharacterized protein n=1 Tax=Steinernema carpocapsae TaxID=34508 RepID=A0A4U5MM96_STECR|nr:hypothetical protein L596_022335 [Steinernema carpocapsae]